MVGSVYKRGDFVWVQDVRANYVCIHEGELVVTVFSTAWQPWHVIFHYPTGAALLQGERFADPCAAMSRAEAIVSGVAEKRAYKIGLPPLWSPECS
ncbi:MAG: hypothetical protein ACLP1D_27680 [Xanthobacteraceae bacterium]